MLNRILELIRTPPQDIIGLSEFIRQLQTLRPTSKPTSEVVRETKQKNGNSKRFSCSKQKTAE